MGNNRRIDIKIITIISFLFSAILFSFAVQSEAYSKAELQKYQRSVTDYRSNLNRRFKKKIRKKTKYIIVHTSELGLKTTLKVVAKGKRVRRGRVTRGGHAHYVIGRNGKTYRIVDKKYRADHAGLSMWKGETFISNVSIGIELAGYHYAPITESQYRSLGMLIDILQKVYGLDDSAVLTHSQIAYGKPNRWFRKTHRGRKRCAKNFVHAQADVKQVWDYDPDVRAGRLMEDPQLAKALYRPRLYTQAQEPAETNVISKLNTAWSIAGADYDSDTTVYKFPDGKVVTGDMVSEKSGWNRIPAGTVVLLNQETATPVIKSEGPVKTISDSLTAWSFAGHAYKDEGTIYFLPSGRITPGSKISDWDDLPAKTRLIIGYSGPFTLDRSHTAYGLAGQKYKDQNTVYYLPSHELLAGDQIKDFTELPAGTMIFLPSG